jgi:nitrogen fixation/metabolism regulation signal transduction histidine kinase
MDEINSSAMGPNPQTDQALQHKHHNLLVMTIFILVAILVAILLLFLIGWLEFNPSDERVLRPNGSLLEEVDNVNLGDLDSDFSELDALIEGL